MTKKLTQKILKRSRLITNLNKVFTLHTIYPLQVLYAAAHKLKIYCCYVYYYIV